MTSAVLKVEQMLALLYGKNHCVLTGSGTAALWAAVQLAQPGRRKILLPSLCCPNLVYAVQLAGLIPVFADIRMSDATIDPELVRDRLGGDKSIAAVIAVHLFGNEADISRLSEICAEHDCLLIEDAAQAVGGRSSDGTLLGSGGDVSILSFGKTKIIDVGSGGALLTDSEALAQRMRSIVHVLPARVTYIEELSNIYKALYYPIADAGSRRAEFYELFGSFYRLFKEMYLYSPDVGTAKAIAVGLETLENEVARRKELARLYRSLLGNVPGITIVTTEAETVPWRYCFLVAAPDRQPLLDLLRSNGIDASSWYPCIANWFERFEGSDERYHAGRKTELEIVNLWLTGSYDASAVARVCKLIVAYFHDRRNREVNR